MDNKFYDYIKKLSLQFVSIRSLYHKDLRLKKQLHNLKEKSENQEFSDFDEIDIQKKKSQFSIKLVAIIFETILAFYGFEFLFYAILGFPFPRWSVFILSFICSFLIIFVSTKILGILKDVNKDNSFNLVSNIPAYFPLFIVPGINIFAYYYDETETKSVYLFLAFIVLLINITVVSVIGIIIYEKKYLSKFDTKYKESKRIRKQMQSLEKEILKIKKQFGTRYNMIETEGVELFKLGAANTEINSLNLNLPSDYLFILQNRIFKNKNINFVTQLEKNDISDTRFLDWWDEMTE